MAIRYFTSVADATELGNIIPMPLPGVAGIAFKRDDNTIQIMDPDGVAGTFLSFSPATALLAIAGVAAGYKIARGIHRQVAAADTVVTGLATVVAAVVSFDDAPTVKQLFVRATIGDQVATPAAGSIIISTFKPTAVNDVTPTAATDFTDTLDFAWVAVGT